jgi:hypothetical protein
LSFVRCGRGPSWDYIERRNSRGGKNAVITIAGSVHPQALPAPDLPQSQGVRDGVALGAWPQSF